MSEIRKSNETFTGREAYVVSVRREETTMIKLDKINPKKCKET